MLENTYSVPQIYGKSLDDEWFIGFTFFCTLRQKSKRPQVRLGINYFASLKSRLAEAENVLLLVTKCLEEGWNPFECNIKDYIKDLRAKQLKNKEDELKKHAEDPRNMGFKAALNWAFKKKKNKENTQGGLKTTLKFALEAANQLDFNEIPIKDITRYHICEILDCILTIRQGEYDISANPRYKGKKVTPNLYNGYLDRISNLMFEFENREIIELNPCLKIKKKDPIDFGTHRHATEKEIEIIKRELPKRHPELYSFMRFIFVTGTRPDEILDLKFSMLDQLNSCINLSDHPYNDMGELISKTTAYRQVPLPKFMLDWILERGQGHDVSEYLFSFKFKPGFHRITRTWVTMLWKFIVIDGLGIDVSIYSFKGLGGDAKREAGVELPAVSVGYGHTKTSLARNTYLQKEGERLRNQVIELSPDL